MKKYSIILMVLVLTAALFTGCGCRNNRAEPTTSMPTIIPTTEATTQPTRATTEATTHATEPSVNETLEDGNGPLPTNATAGPNGDTSNGQNSRSGNAGTGNGTSPRNRMPLG